MARDIPFKPRFFIDHLQFLKHTGIIGAFDSNINDNILVQDTIGDFLNNESAMKLFDFNPTNHINLHYSEYESQNLNGSELKIGFNTGLKKTSDWEGRWYVATLGHNLYSANGKIRRNFANQDFQAHSITQPTEIINGMNPINYNGFSIEEITAKPSDDDYAQHIVFSLLNRQPGTDLGDINLGAISFGKIFDLSISSDMKMSMSYEYGFDTKTSRNGAYLSNSRWFQKPLFAGFPAFELSKEESVDAIGFRKSGRRVYDLSFTYLSGDETLATSGVLDGTTLEGYLFEGDTSGDLTDTDTDNNIASVHEENINIMNDNSIYSQIVHKSMGFQLPFIFQPDTRYSKPDGFMLARVDEKDFQVEQLMPDLYRIKMKIEEIW